MKATTDAPLSIDVLSPPKQGDALSGLTQAVAGVGVAVAPELPGARWPTEPGEADAWAVAVDAATNWYVLLSQDCDIVDAGDEPTVLIAPLVLVPVQEWQVLHRNGYSARRFAYPHDKFILPEGFMPVVDLAWVTTVLKGSLTAEVVRCVRPFTGPNRAHFGEWLATRFGRVPFSTEVVENVLDHFDYVRVRLTKSFVKASQSGGTASMEARAVGAVVRWYSRVDGPRVHVLGELTRQSLLAAGFINDDNELDIEGLAKAQERLSAAVTKRINAKSAHGGYEARVTLADLELVPASQFREFALLVR
ncbi:MAG: hypothetical protein KDB26_09365 [Microthrixaceae bacterium]|nr:hypothetical protein [Microthrixaceae bacterium]